MANFGKVDLDFTLFLRPFTYNSWAVIGATTLVCALVALFYQTSSMEKYQEQTSARGAIQSISVAYRTYVPKLRFYKLNWIIARHM